MISCIRCSLSLRLLSLAKLSFIAVILLPNCAICSEISLYSASLSSNEVLFSKLSVAMVIILLLRASICLCSKSISSEPPFIPIASPMVAFIRVRYVTSSSESNCLKARTIAWCRLDSRTVSESEQYFVPLSSRLIHRHTILFLPCDVQVHLLYLLPHSPHLSTSVNAYFECFPDAVSAFCGDCGDMAFLRLISSCTRLKVFRSMMAG